MNCDFIVSQLDKLNAMRNQLKSITGLSGTFDIELCDICKAPKEREDAVSRCLDCKKNLCESHQHSHDHMFEDHKVIDIAEVFVDYSSPSSSSSSSSSSPSPMQEDFPLCSLHSSKMKDLFCLRCNALICSTCAVDGEHEGHEYTIYLKFSREKKEQTTWLIDEVQNRRQEIETSLDLIGQMETEIQATSISETEQIVSVSDQLRIVLERKIEEHKERLIDELQQKTKEKLDRLTLQRKQLERDLECLDNSVSFSRSLLKNATNEQFIVHLPLIIDQLGRIRKEKRFFQSPIETTHFEVEINKSIDPSDVIRGLTISETQNQSIQRSIQNASVELTARKKTRKRDYRFIAEPILVFGSQGSAAGQFNTPLGISVDYRNFIIVSDFLNNRIQIFDDQGRAQMIVGSEGVGNGQFKNPSSAVVSHHHNIIVSDRNNHRIQIFDQRGKHLKTFGSKGSSNGKFDGPVAVAIDQNNRIIVSDRDNHRVQIFDDQGKHLKSFGSKGSALGKFDCPLGLTVDQNNRIIVCDWNNFRIQIFDENGRYIESFGSQGSAPGQFNRPVGVAVDSHNNIIVSDQDNHRIQFFDDQGNHIKSIGSQGVAPGQFNFPARVAVDHHNNIIVCDMGNNRIQVF